MSDPNPESVQHVVAQEETHARRRMLVALAVAALVLLVLVLLLANSMPPRTVRMATGDVAGAYHAYGQRYQHILARHGVKLELVPTNGSLDNLARLRDAQSDVSIALLQGGITTHAEANGLVSLGTVVYEPVWVFYRGDDLGLREGWVADRRISVGPEGSGTRKLALDIVALLGLQDQRVTLVGLPSREAVEALLGGEVDLIVLVSPFDGQSVQRLLHAPRIKVANFVRADATVALRPFLNKLTLPRGVVDLKRDLPPQDVTLVAPKASLVARGSLHPAVQHLLLQAAVEVHAPPALFQQAGQFPAAEPVDLPLSETARNYYKSGSPLLNRYLPFWAAALVSELLRLLIPVVAVAYPLLRLAPGIYGWGMRRRIFRLYGELKYIETQLETRDAKAAVDDLRERIDWLEARANHMRTPRAFAHMVYTLRLHIRMVRDRIEKR
jgi:TRAP-type uncharacterized transport system substrate-binding protein